MVFFEIIFPVIFIIGLGYLVGRFISELDIKTLSKTTIYILSPALIFTSLLNTTVTAADAGTMFIFTLILTGAIFVVSWLTGRIMNLSRPEQNGLYLSTIFLNAGNFGIPIALFAFGNAGMEREILMLVFQNLLVSTLGVYFASASQLNWKLALKKIFQLPPFYAVTAAFLLRGLQIEIPEPLFNALSLLGQGVVPLFLLALGIQLSRTKLGSHLGFISAASMIRLVISPLLACGLVYLLGAQGVTAKIMILAASTPTAVTATLYSIEFGAAPDQVSAVTLFTTVISMLTITVILWGWLL